MFFFFKQKTAYEMRISDWSSDVCSSDLADPLVGMGVAPVVILHHGIARRGDGLAEHDLADIDADVLVAIHRLGDLRTARGKAALEIGRAACRERVCQYV